MSANLEDTFETVFASTAGCRIFLECSHTSQSNLNTGIQRVVREIVKNLPQMIAPKFEVIPIQVVDDKIEKVILNQPPPTKGTVRSLYTALKLAFFTVRVVAAKLLPNKFRQFLLGARHEKGSLVSYIYRYSGYVRRTLSNTPVSDKLAVQPGDILVLLDSSWHLSIWPAVQAFKDDGGKVVAVIYDIIPIRYPQYCDDRLTLAFKDWLDQSLKLVDGYTAISKSVKMDLYKYLETRASPEEINTKFFSHFHLGADFSTSLSGIGESQIKSIFDNNQKVFLTACTLEPRKNHSQILDSAEILWSQGEDFALLFIGKIGWKIDELLKRIKSHPEYNLRLFLLSNASDQELVFAYKHATALVFASYAEGFGLPIIESLHHSLPVVASDIPVHREIGKDSITYFKLNDSDDLALKMQKLEKGGGKKNTHTIQAQNYTWKSSSKQLFLAVHQLTLR